MNLTPRQRSIAVLVSQGMFNKEIAYELGVTRQTISNLLVTIYKKNNLSSRTQLAIALIKENSNAIKS